MPTSTRCCSAVPPTRTSRPSPGIGWGPGPRASPPPRCDPAVDTLLLGCTHYPYLARVIGDVMGPDVTLVSSADETAFVARSELCRMGLLRDTTGVAGEHRFLSSGDTDWFADLGGRLLGPE